MQDGVDGQIADLTARRIAEALCLISGTLQRDRHIPQRQQAGLGVDVLADVLREGAGRRRDATVQMHRQGRIFISAVGIAHDDLMLHFSYFFL